MSDRYNTAFLRDPLTFVSAHLLCISSTPEARNLKAKEAYSSVASADRVIYWNIQEEDESESGQLCELVCSREPTRGSLPGYWLPWQANAVNKITLHDKRSREEQERTGPPRAFFTSTVNGCSVFVQGDRWTPTVYHTNARDVSCVRTDLERQHRMNVLEGRMSLVSAPKRGDGGLGGLHAHHYMSGAAPDYASLGRGIDPQRVMVSTENGSVFGVLGEEEEGWTFFVQPYLYIFHMSGAPDSETRNKSFVRQPASEFWPGGCGQVVMNRPTPRDYTYFPKEVGASGKSLREHLDLALRAYARRYHLNQSVQSRDAVARLTPKVRDGHASVLHAIHHYLDLDKGMPMAGGLSEKLKPGSSLYEDLMAEYRKWLFGAAQG
jgi:hypothetical protein